MSYLEIIALISTIVCVVLSGREHILAWPIGIVSSLSLILIYLPSHMYANICLQSVFVIQCTIGWYNWGKKDDLKPTSLSKSRFIAHLSVFIGIGCLYATIYKAFNSDTTLINSYLDGISTFIALLGNWYLTKKVIQAWPLFMTYNVIIACLLISQGIYLIAGLNICLFFISLNGFHTWKRNLITD